MKKSWNEKSQKNEDKRKSMYELRETKNDDLDH